MNRSTRVPTKIAMVGALALVGVLVSAALAQAQAPSAQAGDYLFRTYCAACHGTSAKGDGPLADSMRRRPPDLTEIAKRNKGVFPAEEVFRMIDGRTPVKGHGGPDMPVWGDVFARSSEGGDAEAIKRKVESLVRYLEGLQTRASF